MNVASNLRFWTRILSGLHTLPCFEQNLEKCFFNSVANVQMQRVDQKVVDVRQNFTADLLLRPHFAGGQVDKMSGPIKIRDKMSSLTPPCSISLLLRKTQIFMERPTNLFCIS